MASIDSIVALTNKKPRLAADICAKLVISTRELDKLVKQAQAEGYAMRWVDGAVVTKVPILPAPGTYVHDKRPEPGRKTIGHMTDLHAGSLHYDKEAHLEYLHVAWERGARVMMSTGDHLDGKHGDKLTADQETSNLDGQARILRDVLKKAPPFRYLTISGNHDGYFDSAVGFSTGKWLETYLGEVGIKWHHLGQCKGFANVYGAQIMLWHPHGGASSNNALRRIMNTEAERMKTQVDLLLMGHFHKNVPLQVHPEQVYGVAGGTFQLKRSEFANRISGNWDIGGGLIHFTKRPDGTVGESNSEFLRAGE